MRILAAIALAAFAGCGVTASAEPGTIYAAQPGLPAYDFDPFGGNPFASAVIAALENPDLPFEDVLVTETIANSDGLQSPDLSQIGEGAGLVPAPDEEAMALVIVFADYGDEQGLISLPGAAFDAYRVAATLEQAGYGVAVKVARDGASYMASLTEFSRAADKADRALVYTTGHGVEVGGTVYLVPPEAESAPNMLDGALSLPDIRKVFDNGSGARLLLYAGCRDNPLGLRPPEPAAPVRAP